MFTVSEEFLLWLRWCLAGFVLGIWGFQVPATYDRQSGM